RPSVEDRVRQAFAECLEIQDVAPDDDFFAIGGDSLRAAMVLERIFQTLQVRLPPDVFFTSPTPRLLAAAIGTQAADAAPPAESAGVIPIHAEGAASRCSSRTA